MKAYKLVLLSLALALPAQVLLAGNARVQAKTPVVSKQGAPATSVAGPGSSAIEIVRPPARGNLPRAQPPTPPPSGPNLTISSIGWSNEICAGGCPDITRVLHIAKASCDISLYIKNTGGTATGPFRVGFHYEHGLGLGVAKYMDVDGMSANETRLVTFSAERIGYYYNDHPFTITLDVGHRVAETNESDNTMSLSPLSL